MLRHREAFALDDELVAPPTRAWFPDTSNRDMRLLKLVAIQAELGHVADLDRTRGEIHQCGIIRSTSRGLLPRLLP